jgi:hypothetical protein
MIAAYTKLNTGLLAYSRLCRQYPKIAAECLEAGLAEWPSGTPDKVRLSQRIATRVGDRRPFWNLLGKLIVNIIAGVVSHFLVIMIFASKEPKTRRLIAAALVERRA